MSNAALASTPQLPLSAVVKTLHGLIFMSGQIAERSLLTSRVAVQTKSLCRAIDALLSAEGKGLADVVRVDFEAFNESYRAFFTAPLPARTTVAVRALPFGAKVEIEAEAP